MRIVVVLVAIVTLLTLHVAARADVFNLGPGLTSLETVTVGNPGNTADTRYANPGYGSVSYTYSIGRYEVTAAQYCDFLNAKAKSDPYGLYNTCMWDGLYGCKIQRTGTDGSYSYSIAADYANRPVNYVSYWDALRFANWLGNGQGDGDTETGAYNLNGYNGNDGCTILRNANCKWVVTSEDEWYKAAYYKSGGNDAGYWDYPTQSNAITTGMANLNWSVEGTTDVGSYSYASAYGTLDQSGNVWEWNEAVYSRYAYCVLRGGSFNCGSSQAVARGLGSPLFEDGDVGFRVSQVPEPSSILALAGGIAGLGGFVLRRRKA